MAERKPFLLRLPPDLADAMQRWARDELRSLNAQIEFVLREALRRRGRMSDAAPANAQPANPQPGAVAPPERPANPPAILDQPADDDA